MKKTLSTLICALLLLAISLSLGSCASNQTADLIDFDKKYKLDEDTYYVFHSDHTGSYEQYYHYESENNPSYSYTESGRVDFVWREASDGAVYLFSVDVHYNEDHTEGETLGLISKPIYFGEDFFTYTTHSQYGSTTHTYIKEGSELEKLLND